MYVLIIECFANVVRLDSHIRGLKIPGFRDECKISQYVDDCSFTVVSTSSVCKIFEYM